MNSIKVCEYSRSRSFHDDLILQDQASGERSQDQWSSGDDIRLEACTRKIDDRLPPSFSWNSPCHFGLQYCMTSGFGAHNPWAEGWVGGQECQLGVYVPLKALFLVIDVLQRYDAMLQTFQMALLPAKFIKRGMQ